MASLLTIVLLLSANLLLTSADDCKCSEEIPQDQLDELWKFLSENNADVLPGELSEFVPCRNCIEQNRRKRRIEEDVVREIKREGRSIFPHVHTSRGRYGDSARNKCPIGYRKLFWRCLKY